MGGNRILRCLETLSTITAPRERYFEHISTTEKSATNSYRNSRETHRTRVTSERAKATGSERNTRTGARAVAGVYSGASETRNASARQYPKNRKHGSAREVRAASRTTLGRLISLRQYIQRDVMIIAGSLVDNYCPLKLLQNVNSNGSGTLRGNFETRRDRYS